MTTVSPLSTQSHCHGRRNRTVNASLSAAVIVAASSLIAPPRCSASALSPSNTESWNMCLLSDRGHSGDEVIGGKYNICVIIIVHPDEKSERAIEVVHKRRCSPFLESELLSSDDAVAFGEWKALPDIWRTSAEKFPNLRNS
ncbi:Long-chain-fatty-acid--[acyl-carrier-protein] ligase AEE15, chloroplastic-like protein [Drosera capensis]